MFFVHGIPRKLHVKDYTLWKIRPCSSILEVRLALPSKTRWQFYHLSYRTNFTVHYKFALLFSRRHLMMTLSSLMNTTVAIWIFKRTWPMRLMATSFKKVDELLSNPTTSDLIISRHDLVVKAYTVRVHAEMMAYLIEYVIHFECSHCTVVSRPREI